MLGTSLHDMSIPSRGSKQTDAVKKAREQGVPHVEKKGRLSGLNERMGRGRGAETQSQPPPATKRLQG